MGENNNNGKYLVKKEVKDYSICVYIEIRERGRRIEWEIFIGNGTASG